jgi:hypothetical protein
LSDQTLTRIYPGEDGKLNLPSNSYGKEEGIWYIRPPRCHVGSLRKHSIVEHEDGTITVSPSILQHDYEIGPDGYKDIHLHGMIERGIWRDC